MGAVAGGLDRIEWLVAGITGVTAKAYRPTGRLTAQMWRTSRRRRHHQPRSRRPATSVLRCCWRANGGFHA